MYFNICYELKDLDSIDAVWGLTQEWHATWIKWKSIRFSDIQPTEMENQSVSVFKKFSKLSKELKVICFSLLYVIKCFRLILVFQLEFFFFSIHLCRDCFD